MIATFDRKTLEIVTDRISSISIAGETESNFSIDGQIVRKLVIDSFQLDSSIDLLIKY